MWHFDLLEIIWHQLQTSIVSLMQLLCLVFWTKMQFAMSEINLQSFLHHLCCQLCRPVVKVAGFCGDRRPEGHVFHTSRQAMIKTYYSTSIRKNMVQICSYFTQMKSTTTAIDDSNRRRNKLGLGCSREATAPLILIFKLIFLWLNIGRHFKGITQFHNCHSPKHTSKNITW